MVQGTWCRLSCRVLNARPEPTIVWQVSDETAEHHMGKQHNDIHHDVYNSNRHMAILVMKDILVYCNVSHPHMNGFLMTSIQLDVQGNINNKDHSLTF